MSKRKLLFVDRDGTLLVEPADRQIDSLSKFQLVEDCIFALRRLVDAGYELVMVSNQDGLGTASFPEADFWPAQHLLLQILASHGIRFSDILIDRHFEHEASDTRKPGLGMVLKYLQSGTMDMQQSVVVGDRESDEQLARNMGLRGFRLQANGWSWSSITRALLDAPRQAVVERKTKETDIRVKVDLDSPGPQTINTGIGFFDHMLDQLGRHGGFALEIDCRGDLHIDEHHTVEDCALALGQALRSALGDKRGLARYGFHVPMDESRAQALLDFSGRPYFVFEGRFPREQVGGLHTEMVPHFFRSLAETLACNLHISVEGENTHHMIEACFKATARAMRMALQRHGSDLPSTKGMLA